MNAQSTSTARYALTAYLILTPLISLAIALFLPIPPVAIALILILVAAIMGILMAAITEGGRGVADLLKKLLQWRVNLKWYAAALGLPAGIVLAAGGLAYLLGWMPAVQFQRSGTLGIDRQYHLNCAGSRFGRAGLARLRPAQAAEPPFTARFRHVDRRRLGDLAPRRRPG